MQLLQQSSRSRSLLADRCGSDLNVEIVRTLALELHEEGLLKGHVKLENIVRLLDCNALFMYDFYSNRLPPTFSDFFRSVSGVHQYNTRLARKKSYYLPKIRTNYGKFNIRYIGVKVWNSIHEDFKSNSRSCFKRLLAKSFLNLY